MCLSYLDDLDSQAAQIIFPQMFHFTGVLGRTYEVTNVLDTSKSSLPIRCTIFIIHRFCSFRPQHMTIFRELQTSFAHAAHIAGSSHLFL